MRLRKDTAAVMERIKKFSLDSIGTGALIYVDGIREIKGKQTPPLEEWDVLKDFRPWLEAGLDNLTDYWNSRQDVRDDRIPTFKPMFGIAEHSAFLGGEVSFGGSTSYHHAFIKNYETDLEKIRFDSRNPWFRLIMDSLSYLKDRMKDLCVLTMRGADSPLDIANAIRGNDIFTDFYDAPEELGELLSVCTKAMNYTADHQKEIVGGAEGGIWSGYNIWVPGDSFGHLSEDAAAMCSLATYREFGQEYLRKAIEPYDQIMIHTHAMGRHTLPAIAELEKIRYIEITRDPGQPAPIEVLKQYEETLSCKTVILNITRQEAEENLELLRKFKTVLLYQADSIRDANYMCDYIRDALPVLTV